MQPGRPLLQYQLESSRPHSSIPAQKTAHSVRTRETAPYTSGQGLLGILNSSRLWATNYRFLNDSSEIAYGGELLETAIQDRISANASDSVVTEFLNRFRRPGHIFKGFVDAYIACFCERDDLLSQWRTYGVEGGFAIGFEAPQLVEQWGPSVAEQRFFLRRVIYDPVEQRSLIDQVFNAAIAALTDAAGTSSVDEATDLIALTCEFVRNATAEYLLWFKHSAFAIENEWRLCHITEQGNDGHVKFRVGQFGLTPYVELDPSPRAGVHSHRLPIASVTHEPARYPEIIQFAIRKLLLSKRYPFAEISGSSIPVRSNI